MAALVADPGETGVPESHRSTSAGPATAAARSASTSATAAQVRPQALCEVPEAARLHEYVLVARALVLEKDGESLGGDARSHDGVGSLHGERGALGVSR